MNIWQDSKLHQGHIVTKWSHYFPIYEGHLTSWRNKSVEIGVLKGGSLQMWQRFFGPRTEFYDSPHIWNQFYDSVIVIERGTVPFKTDIQSAKALFLSSAK